MHSTVMSGGQIISGGVVSSTVIVKVHGEELPEESVAVQVTMVSPIGKRDPEDGLQET